MIKTFPITQLTNPMHIQFMDYVVTLVSNNNPTTLNVQTQWNTLSQTVTELKDLYKTTQGSPITDQITEADTWRDTLWTGIMKVVDGFTYHFDPEMTTCATLLQKSTTVYGTNIVRNDLQTETAKIESIVTDWTTKPELQNAVDVLGIFDWVTQLQTANTEFKRLYALRTTEMSQRPTETMWTKRTEVNTAYTELCTFLNSYSVVTTPNTTFETVITGINTYVEQYWTLMKQRGTRTTVVNPQEN